MPSPPHPAFIVGISGRMDLPEEDLPVIRERLTRVFKWLRDDPKEADHRETAFPGWWPRTVRPKLNGRGEARARPLPGLGLGDARIVLLTSLAPGSDTLAARVAREHGIEVRAALPFPPDLYRRSTSFTAAADPARAVADLDAFLTEPEESLDRFEVLMESDQSLPPAERRKRFEEDLEIPERRRLRYRAAGEFVAAHSHLMLALYQPDLSPLPVPLPDTDAGTEAIVLVRRRGPTPGILPAGSNFHWIDSGEVFHLPVRSRKRLAAPGDSETADWTTLPGRLLPPQSAGCPAEHDQPPESCVAAGYRHLAEGARLCAVYDHWVRKTAAGPDNDCLASSFGRGLAAGTGLSDPGQKFLGDLVPLLQTQRISSDLATMADLARGRMMIRLAVCAFVAAVAFHGFAHWHAQKPHHSAGSTAVAPAIAATPTPSPAPAAAAIPGKSPQGCLPADPRWDREALFFLSLSLGAILFAGFAHWHYHKSRLEALRFDARAFSEGLRVQAYWFAAGLPASVASRYMHRQKGELDWIRNGISSLSFPYHRWKDHFDDLPPADRRLLLRSVIDHWVKRQRDFFARNGIAKHRRQLHRHEILGWGLTWAGIGQVLLLLVWKAADPESRCAVVVTLAGAMLLAGAVRIVYAHRVDPGHGAPEAHGPEYPEKNPLLALLDRLVHPLVPPKGVIALAAALAGSVALLAFALSHHCPSLSPPHKDLWIILTGATLVTGAITIAWGEKLVLAEHTRQYTAMHSLFQHALDRAEGLYADWTRAGETPPDSAVADPLTRLQELLADLGKEALDENAEWLLLHRSRPLEPFLAG